MRKLKLFAVLFTALTLLVAVPAQAAMQDMWAYVYKWTGGMNTDGTPVLTRLTSGVTFKVLASGTTTAETLYVYGSAALTSLTNPVSTSDFASATVCNDKVAFRVDPTDSTNDRYVDLIVVNTTGGYTALIENFDKYQHTIVFDERPNIMHHGMIWFEPTTTDETSTGITLPYRSLIHDVRVEITVTASADTIDVGLLSSGTGGDADGFRVGVLTTTKGFPKDTAVITAGTVSTDYYPVSTYGALLYTAITGTGTADLDMGGRTYLGYVHDGTSTGVLTYSCSSTQSKGFIHYFFTKMR
jgi:hypothetical protein